MLILNCKFLAEAWEWLLLSLRDLELALIRSEQEDIMRLKNKTSQMENTITWRLSRYLKYMEQEVVVRKSPTQPCLSGAI